MGRGSDMADFIVDMLGDIDRDVAAVTLGPPFLPEIAGHFGHIHHLLRKTGAIV